MKVYTDLPIEKLGDLPHRIAPVREVKIISYDGNKYCHVEVNGVMLDIKTGYLYSKKGRHGEVPNIGERIDEFI